jgi:hypothetical protein
LVQDAVEYATYVVVYTARNSRMVNHAIVSRALKLYARNLIQLHNIRMEKSKPSVRTTPLLTNLILLSAVLIQRQTGKQREGKGAFVTHKPLSITIGSALVAQSC